jgi:hypothetical protein
MYQGIMWSSWHGDPQSCDSHQRLCLTKMFGPALFMSWHAHWLICSPASFPHLPISVNLFSTGAYSPTQKTGAVSFSETLSSTHHTTQPHTYQKTAILIFSTMTTPNLTNLNTVTILWSVTTDGVWIGNRIITHLHTQLITISDSL